MSRLKFTQILLINFANDYNKCHYDKKQFFDFMKSNPQMQEQVRAPIFEDKVIDFIFELVEVSEKTVKKADLEKAVKKLEES